MIGVSIHAPVKGATGWIKPAMAEINGFNPRSREGSDALVPLDSHTPSGFNPRSREGSDRNSITL